MKTEKTKKRDWVVLPNGDVSENFSTLQKVFLGLQNTLAMTGVIIVPILCGLDVSVTLFCAGIGTLIYQFIDKRMVPAFLGGSFAIIAPVKLVIDQLGLPYAQIGIVAMALFYFLFALLLKLVGKERVQHLFPAIIVGPIIMVLGLSLAHVGVNQASDHWPVALITLAVAIGINCFGKGLTKVLTIVIALVVGYLVAIPFNLIDFQPVIDAPWIGVPNFTFPTFAVDENWWKAVLLIMPAAIVPCLEHIGDVIAVGTAVGKDFTEEPGLPRSIFGCGVATTISGLLGGPSLTIHSENTGVLAVTKLFSPFIVACGAAWMALLSFCPKVGALFTTIPSAVMGGVGILLYGMVTIVGIRTLVDSRVDFGKARNLSIVSVILILGVGGASFTFGNFSLSSMAISAIVGIILHLVLPGRSKAKKNARTHEETA